MCSHLLGNLVAFEDVCEGMDTEPELLCKTHEHENLALHIGVTVDVALAVKNLDQRIKLNVATYRL